jgi:hypothetical protein
MRILRLSPFFDGVVKLRFTDLMRAWRTKAPMHPFPRATHKDVAGSLIYERSRISWLALR